MFCKWDRTNRSGESVGFYRFMKLFALFWKTKDRKEKVICPLCRVTSNRMIKSQEQDEFIAVRVQDPRLQNEGSWNSYVDFKIFLHTNSKAFTAKTSCVRRRYSEFVWLKRKLQKNAGLVPVPDLPKKSFFSFINDDFIERRRKGLQSFLDKLLHMTVCLSDSQLHLFLQTQLPIKHIEDCVQGHTPYTVTEAILTYASSNRGWAQEEGVGVQELWTAPITYESTESPAPHLPTSSRLEPPSESTDASDLETVLILSDTEQTGSDSKEESDPEHMIQERDRTINVVVIAESDESKKTQKLDGKDLQRDGHEYRVTQSDEPQGDLDCLDKAEQEIYSGSDIERRTIDGTTEEEKGQCECIGKDLVKAEDQTYEDVALDGTCVSVENIQDAKHQEHSEAEITDESEISDEEKVNETGRTHSEINETCLSTSECSENDVGAVNEINAKNDHAASSVLILEGSEEAPVTQTAPVTDDRNLDANTADVSTLVLQAIEVDSVQCLEKDCHMIIASQQPDVK